MATILTLKASRMVSLTFASWNQIVEWLGRVDGVRQAA